MKLSIVLSTYNGEAYITCLLYTSDAADDSITV